MFGSMKNIGLAGFISLVLSGCLPFADGSTPLEELSFTVLAFGQFPVTGIYGNKKLEVFREQSALDAIVPAYLQPGAISGVDFSSEQVFLATLGQRNSGGFEVATQAVKEFTTHILVTVHITVPGPNCIVDTALSEPFEFVLINSRKELIFSETYQQQACN